MKICNLWPLLIYYIILIKSRHLLVWKPQNASLRSGQVVMHIMDLFLIH